MRALGGLPFYSRGRESHANGLSEGVGGSKAKQNGDNRRREKLFKRTPTGGKQLSARNLEDHLVGTTSEMEKQSRNGKKSFS